MPYISFTFVGVYKLNYSCFYTLGKHKLVLYLYFLAIMIGESFSKYFALSDTEDFMGIKVTDIGYGHIPPNTQYPEPIHPKGYFFNWENGRRLDDIQLVYISKGKGILELEGLPQIEISAGTLFILYPHVWHRYKPVFSVGWDEYWIGFNGNTDLSILHNDILNTSSPVHVIGINNTIIKLFDELITIAKEQTSGFSASMAGGAFYLTGLLINALKNYGFKSTKSEKQMQKTIGLLYENINKNINLESIAVEVGMSYSLFRKTFTRYTGLSPNQYFLKLKLSKSLDLLRYSDLQVKEIGDLLGFDTIQYFTRFIKQKTGKSPGSFRK